MPSASAAAPCKPLPVRRQREREADGHALRDECGVMADGSRKSLCVTRSPLSCRVNSSSGASSKGAPSTMPAAAR